MWEIRLLKTAVVLVVLAAMELFLWGFGLHLPCIILIWPLTVIAFPILFGVAVILIITRWSKFSRREKAIRLGLVLLCILPICLTLVTGGRALSDLAMYLNVARTGGIDRLQSWAIDILNKPEADALEDGKRFIQSIKPELLSGQVKKLTQGGSAYIKQSGDTYYIIVPIGGGSSFGLTWGLYLTLPNVQLHLERKLLTRWRDGVYSAYGRSL